LFSTSAELMAKNTLLKLNRGELGEMSAPLLPQTFPGGKASLRSGVALPGDIVKPWAPSVFRGRLGEHLSGMIWVYLILPWGRGGESR